MATVSIERRALLWMASGDTGTSSMTLCRHMLALPHDGTFGVSEPSDGSDLGRCCRLLLIIPEWVPRIPEMASLSNAWAALAPHWTELTDLLASETGPQFDKYNRAPKTYARIRAITKMARDQDGWVSFGKGASVKF
jgi:hypothetical protein